MRLIDVHCIDLDAALDLEHWQEWLDDEERALAAGFRFERDRRRYVVRHGWLRELLGRRLDASPTSFRFAHNRFGKPSLPGREVSFNMSRSAGKAICVVADGLELGCDLEARNADLATRAVAERFFSRPEQASLSALPDDLWVDGFFNCWTRKEAYIKARGFGLSYPLNAFDVSVGDRAELVRGCSGWSVRAFEPAPGFVAAVVAEGRDWALRFSD